MDMNQQQQGWMGHQGYGGGGWGGGGWNTSYEAVPPPPGTEGASDPSRRPSQSTQSHVIDL